MLNRKVPVKERVMLNIEAALRKITTDRGYNTNVTHVTRTKELPGNTQPPGTVMIAYVDEEENSDYSSTHHRAFNLPVEIYVFGDHSRDPDSEFNFIQADIETLFANEILHDDFHPQPCQATILTKFIHSNPWYSLSGQRPIVGGWFEYVFTYRHICNSVYKWDSSDTIIKEADLSNYELQKD